MEKHINIEDGYWLTIRKVCLWYMEQEEFKLPPTYKTLDKKHAVNWLLNRRDNLVTESEAYGLVEIIKYGNKKKAFEEENVEVEELLKLLNKNMRVNNKNTNN